MRGASGSAADNDNADGCRTVLVSTRQLGELQGGRVPLPLNP